MPNTAFAQSSTTGVIEGVVTDQNGAAVPGVAVQIAGANLIRPQTATTNDEGVYRISNVPPGTYTVTVEAAKGFSKFETNNVGVNLSKATTVDVKLEVGGGDGNVVNVAASPDVDVTGTETGTNISTEQFSNFPTQRTVQSIYTIAPTTTRSGLRDASGRDRDPSVGGSSGPENNYILDGVTTTDPAFGGSGANLPFEFVQEVEVKTGSFGAEYGKATGGIFNVITKSGGNSVTGDAFAFYSAKGLVRDTKQFPFTGSAPNGFSEVDAGFDIGGPIIKDRLWFFGAVNPQQRKNNFLTQTFRQNVQNKVVTPFYAGKITYAINDKNTLTFSTFGDYTKQTNFLFGSSGFGADPNSFRGTIETGGTNYTVRLNSTISSNFVGEFLVGVHRQRANTLPEDGQSNVPLISDSFVVLNSNNQVLTPVSTNIVVNAATGTGDFVNGTGGSLQRGFLRQGFGLFSNQKRNRNEAAARLQSTFGRQTIKYGFEFARNSYTIDQTSTGPNANFNSAALTTPNGIVNGYRVANNFGVCTIQGTNIACPAAALTSRIQALLTAGQNLGGGITSVSTNAALTSAQLSVNPFLIRTTTRVRDFQLHADDTYTDTESFYVQDDIKVAKNFQLNLGLRWDYQQATSQGVTYIKLNKFQDNIQPRLGFTYDFTGQGKGKIFASFSKYLETPVPLDLNVRAGGSNAQTDKNVNVSRLNAGAGSVVTQDIGNLGASQTPVDFDLKPQSVYEFTAGFEYEAYKNLVIGARGIYRPQGTVIEDGSFDDGNNYFIFNPGESNTERLACADPTIGCFGHARRYYRAVEVTATKRFSNNFQFITSYVHSSLIGNYEGLFRNDNGQADPNITSLFDLVSLLKNTYGRLPNDRPNQFKFDGSYQFPYKVVVGASFRAQSGSPFSQLTPHPVYGNNEGFAVTRGTAVVPTVSTTVAGFPNEVNSIGKTRTPFTTNLDLTGAVPIRFDEKRELRFQVDWFNVFNTQRAILLDQTFSVNSGIPGLPASGPGSLQFGNPFYGSGTVFQFPSNVRLGIKFKF